MLSCPWRGHVSGKTNSRTDAKCKQYFHHGPSNEECNMMKAYDVLAIGGGPAGITIAKVLGRKMKVGIIRPEDHSMIYCAMPYVLENLISKEKTLKRDELVTGSGAELIRSTVTDVTFNEKVVTLVDGTKCAYDKLIIATGADPVIPEVNRTDLRQVYTFKRQSDLDLIEHAIKGKKTKKTVVVGAGAIGIELAQALNSVIDECHLVEMSQSVLPNLIDQDFSSDVEKELKKLGVILHLNSPLPKIDGYRSARSVVLENGETISLDHDDIIVFAAGMKANVGLFDGTGLEFDSYGIVVNDKMETNIKDVYAVGDCVQFKSGITGEITPGKLATNAVPMARVVANNLLGDDRSYPGFYNGAATKVGALFVGGTGLTEQAAEKIFDITAGYSASTTTFSIMPGLKHIRMKLIADKDSLRIIGGQIVSGNPVTDKIDIITLAIQAGLSVRDLVNLSYSAQPYQSFFPANNPIVACAEDILTKLGRHSKTERLEPAP